MNPDEPTSDTAPEPAPTPAPHPHPAAPAEETAPPAPILTPFERLEQLTLQAELARLKPALEEECVGILCGFLASGGAGLASALSFFPRLNWNISVSALNAAWPEMSDTAKDALASGLKREEFRTENARRVRLSLARGIFKQDIDACAKLIAGVCGELRKAAEEGDPIDKSERRNFDSVMIGKGRPWICQIPLAHWRAADSNPVIQVAIDACFSGGSVPPFTQLGLLRWLSEGERLEKLPTEALAPILEAVAKWSPKWKLTLKREIAGQPEALAALVAGVEEAAKPAPVKAEGRRSDRRVQEATEGEKETEAGADDRATADGDADDEEAEDLADEEDEDEEDEEEDEDADDEEEEEDEDGADEDAEPGTAASAPAEGAATARVSRRERLRQHRLKRAERRGAAGSGEEPTAGDGRSERAARGDRSERGDRAERNERGTDFRETMRLLERQFNALKTELDVARSNLRLGERSGKKKRGFERPEPHMPESEQAALRQHNERLEATVAELRTQLEELKAGSEDMAVSQSAFAEGPTPGEREQFQVLLGLKLVRAKTDFEAMRGGRLRDDVFGDNYRSLLEQVFGALHELGVKFPEVPEPEIEMNGGVTPD